MKKIKISWIPHFGNHRSFAKNASRHKQKQNLKSYCFTLKNYGKVKINVPARMVKKWSKKTETRISNLISKRQTKE